MIPNPFKQDTWVTSIEIRPGDPSVVHHVIVQIPEQMPQQAQQAQQAQRTIVRNASITVCADCRTDAQVQKVNARLAANPVVVVDNRIPHPGTSYSDVLVRLRERQTGQGAFTTMEAVYAPGTKYRVFWALILATPDEKRG